jgi:hypothetical protein
MARCTILSLFGLQEWFDKRFLDLCVAHDEAYELRVWREKVTSDFILAAGFASRGYGWMGYLSLLYTGILGTPFWLFRGWRQGAWKR